MLIYMHMCVEENQLQNTTQYSWYKSKLLGLKIFRKMSANILFVPIVELRKRFVIFYNIECLLEKAF